MNSNNTDIKNNGSGNASAVIKKQFPVTGMGCAACANRIETTLNRQAGVIKGIVNFASQTAMVEYDQTVVKPQQLKESIQSIGYDLLTEDTGSAEDDAAELQKKNS
jgi:P-type Cu2+ transporter